MTASPQARGGPAVRGAGAGSPDRRRAPGRPGSGPGHRGVRLGLRGIAAGRPGPGAAAARAAAGRARHRVPPGGERGARRDRGAGDPAGGRARGRAGGRHHRLLVQQVARSGPRVGRAAAREPDRHKTPWGDATAAGRAHAVLLLRLPAQQLDQGTGRLDGRRRHRLPRAGADDGAGRGRRSNRADADGRRGRAVDRDGTVPADPQAPAAEHRRRHVPPLGQPGRAGGHRQRRRHHVQAAVQLRGRDDRRAGRGRRDGDPRVDPGAGRRGGAPHHRHHRRAPPVPTSTRSPTRSARRPAAATRSCWTPAAWP